MIPVLEIPLIHRDELPHTESLCLLPARRKPVPLHQLDIPQLVELVAALAPQFRSEPTPSICVLPEITFAKRSRQQDLLLHLLLLPGFVDLVLCHLCLEEGEELQKRVLRIASHEFGDVSRNRCSRKCLRERLDRFRERFCGDWCHVGLLCPLLALAFDEIFDFVGDPWSRRRGRRTRKYAS